MRSSRLVSGVLGATMAITPVAVGVSPPAVGAAEARASAASAQDGPIRIDLTRGQGPTFRDWGFDIKQKSVAHKLAGTDAAGAAARAAVFGSGDFQVLRIALRADRTAVTKGSYRVVPAPYADTVAAAAAVKREYPAVQIFASLKTIDDCSLGDSRCADFAPWLKPKGKLSARRYGKLVGHYLRYMRKNGVPVSVLGIDNEGSGSDETYLDSNNEGRIGGAKFAKIIKVAGGVYGRTMPRLTFNDAKLPDTHTLCGLTAAQKRLVDYSATHYDATKRMKRKRTGVAGAPAKAFARDQLARLRKCLPGKGAWQTELHYSKVPDRCKAEPTKAGCPSTYDHNQLGVVSVLDQFDAGFTGIVWWSYRGTGNDPTGQIQQALVTSTAGANALWTSDGDGVLTGATTKSKHWLTSRAFRSGQDINLWVVNDTAQDLKNKTIAITNAQGALRIPARTSVTYTRWKRSGDTLVRTQGNGRVTDKRQAQVPLPQKTITLVTLHQVL